MFDNIQSSSFVLQCTLYLITFLLFFFFVFFRIFSRNLTRLQDHRSADGVYWTGLHAPDTNSSLSLFWDDCSVSTNVGITNNGSTANGYQCVAMYSRDVSYVELHRSMCNETYPFICSTNWNGKNLVTLISGLISFIIFNIIYS
jgi:hypothetical protein